MTHESPNGAIPSQAESVPDQAKTNHAKTNHAETNHAETNDAKSDQTTAERPSGLAVVPSRPTPSDGFNPSGFNSNGLSSNGFNFSSLGAQREFEPRIAKLEAEMDQARSRGVFGLMRLRYEAWLEERMKGPAIQKMQARQAILEQQCKTAEVEIRLKATVQSGEVGAQRQRIEWNEINRQRLAGELQSLGLIHLAPAPMPAAMPSAAPVAPHVTDEQVEAVALRGLLQGVETEEDWQSYKSELSRHLSPYAVEEVGQRLRELWRLNRQAQAV